jgi:hypothetical protein
MLTASARQRYLIPHSAYFIFKEKQCDTVKERQEYKTRELCGQINVVN